MGPEERIYLLHACIFRRVAVSCEKEHRRQLGQGLRLRYPSQHQQHGQAFNQ